ncbi:MAG: DUF368 domain-containing protein [Defluviitaleaceae bacterium]|nr:DUF368 domain-containing protein [Defluviitaleaceae bacterium]
MINIIKGALIGLGLVLPGLSGSAFAVVVGLYDRIIEACNGLRRDFRGSVGFLLPIGGGAAAGIFASVGITVFALVHFPFQSYALFVGLVIGGIPGIVKNLAGRRDFRLFALGLIGFCGIVALGVFAPDSDAAIIAIERIGGVGDFAIIALAGLISCSLMLIPGMSGAVMLMLLGQFGTIYAAANNLAGGAIMLVTRQSGGIDMILTSLHIIAAFAIGAIIGLMAAARLVGYFLDKHREKLYALVMGLIFGGIVLLIHMGIAENMVAAFSQSPRAAMAHLLWLAAFVMIGIILTKFISTKEKV